MLLSTLFLAITLTVCSSQSHEKDSHVDHESILAETRNEDERLSKMSPAEGRKRLRAVAKRMDTNNDGAVDREELKNYVRQSLAKIETEDAVEIFMDADENKDGVVTLEENRRHYDFDKDDDDEEDQKTVDEEHLIFKAADLDQDGKLNREEFLRFKNPENYPDMHNTLIDQALRSKDTNNDEFVDLQEFLASKDQQDEAWLETEKTHFEEYDKNRDGKLDREEIGRWLAPDQETTTEEETDHLMDQGDKNHDGKLSYAEIEQEYEAFALSEATNYGADLEDIPKDEL